MPENKILSIPSGLERLYEHKSDSITEAKPAKKERKKPQNEYESHFSILNRFVDQTLKSDLTGTEVKVWLFLLRHSKKGIASVGYSKMMKDLKTGKTAISKAVNNLIEKNVIERICQGNNLTNSVSKYRLL